MKRKQLRTFSEVKEMFHAGTLPPMAGGADLATVLASIESELVEARKRAEAGDEGAREEVERLEAEKAEVETAAKSGDDDAENKDASEEDDEVTRLRKEARERQLDELARKELLSEIREANERQARERQSVESRKQKMLSELIESGAADSLIVGRAKQITSGSRFVADGADPSLVDHVAKGGSYKEAEQVKVGEDRDVKNFIESKSWGTFCRSIMRIRSGVGTDQDRKYLMASFHSVQKRRAKSMGFGVSGIKAPPPMAELTPGDGGFLVPQEWMDDILPLLRANTIIRRANPRIVPFNKQMNQTSISAGASAFWLASEGARISPSGVQLAEAPILTPKALGCLVPVSNYLLNDAPTADNLIRDEMVEVMSLEEDSAFIAGTGSGVPTGLTLHASRTLNPLSITATDGGNGITFNIPRARAIRGRLRAMNARNPRLVWIFHPDVLTLLTTQTDQDGRPLLDTSLLSINDDDASGTLDGVPFYTTTIIPTNETQGSGANLTTVSLINMAEVVIGENQELTLDVSREASWSPDGTAWHSAFQQDQSLFRAVTRVDINSRRPAQIFVQQRVKTT